MKKGIEIKQHDITDCGAACLASIAAYYGLHMSIAKIRQLASTDCKGTNGLGVLDEFRWTSNDRKGSATNRSRVYSYRRQAALDIN